MTRETFLVRLARTFFLIVGVFGASFVLAQGADAPPLRLPSAPAQQPAQQPAPPKPLLGAPTPARTPPPAPTPDPAQSKSPGSSLRVVDRIVAVVNEEVITSNELQIRLRIAESQLQRQNIALPARPVLTRQVLERMV